MTNSSLEIEETKIGLTNRARAFRGRQGIFVKSESLDGTE